MRAISFSWIAWEAITFCSAIYVIGMCILASLAWFNMGLQSPLDLLMSASSSVSLDVYITNQFVSALLRCLSVAISGFIGLYVIKWLQKSILPQEALRREESPDLDKMPLNKALLLVVFFSSIPLFLLSLYIIYRELFTNNPILVL